MTVVDIFLSLCVGVLFTLLFVFFIIAGVFLLLHDSRNITA